jgi:hypothetical protein
MSARVHASAHINMKTCMYANGCNTYIYIYTYIHTHTHINIHAYAQISQTRMHWSKQGSGVLARRDPCVRYDRDTSQQASFWSYSRNCIPRCVWSKQSNGILFYSQTPWVASCTICARAATMHVCARGGCMALVFVCVTGGMSLTDMTDSVIHAYERFYAACFWVFNVTWVKFVTWDDRAEVRNLRWSSWSS